MNLDNGAAFVLALFACLLGGLALVLLVLMALRLFPKPAPRLPQLGSGGYPIPPAPFASQQEVREHLTGAYSACDAPTRRMSVVDGLDPLPFCERCGQRVRRS